MTNEELFDYYYMRPRTDDAHLDFLTDRTYLMEKALRSILSDPGSPHHGAAEALKILNEER